MTYRILVKPSGISFDVQQDETILEAAIRCGHFFPHHCRMGVCGTCKGQLLQGKVAYIRKEILGLTPDEKQNGDVLFCSVKPMSDLVIQVNDFARVELTKAKECLYDVVSSELISKETTQIILRPTMDSHLSYQAGQYIKIVHPDGNVSPLSIANAPAKDLLIELQLTHPLVNSPAQDILSYITKKKRLLLRGPYGYCTTGELYREQPIIFLARGTGFSPIKAIIEEMVKFKKYPQMHFYWSVTSPDEFYMHELLKQWTQEIDTFSYTRVLSRPDPVWAGKVGLLQDMVLNDYPDLTRYLVYTSAPEPVVYDVMHELQKAGLARDHYYSDVFDYDPNE